MTMFEQIQNLGLQELVLAKNHLAIAEILSNTNTRTVSTAIGKGTILSVLGFEAGNAFLDVIDTQPTYRHVKDIIGDSKFDVSLDVSKQGILAMVPAVVTQEQADALIALGKEKVPVSVQEVAQALELGA